MKCRDVRRYICAYLDNELDTDIMISVGEHIVSCNCCKNELKACISVKKLLKKRCFHSETPENLKNRVVAELQRIDEYCESGVQALDLVRWGTHVAHLYETERDLFEILVPYLAKGLEQNERCLWITADITKKKAIDGLIDEIPDPYAYMDKGQLEVISYKDWYLSNGCFDKQCVLNEGLKKYRKALSDGYPGFRIAGTTKWLHTDDWESFMEYESLLSQNMPNSKQLAICAYEQSHCTGKKMDDVMKNHQYTLTKTCGHWRAKRDTN